MIGCAYRRPVGVGAENLDLCSRFSRDIVLHIRFHDVFRFRSKQLALTAIRASPFAQGLIWHAPHSWHTTIAVNMEMLLSFELSLL